MAHGRGSDCLACNDPAANAAGFPRFFYGREAIVVAHTMEEWLGIFAKPKPLGVGTVPVKLKAKYR
jgi:hypothetical protein